MFPDEGGTRIKKIKKTKIIGNQPSSVCESSHDDKRHWLFSPMSMKAVNLSSSQTTR